MLTLAKALIQIGVTWDLTVDEDEGRESIHDVGQWKQLDIIIYLFCISTR